MKTKFILLTSFIIFIFFLDTILALPACNDEWCDPCGDGIYTRCEGHCRDRDQDECCKTRQCPNCGNEDRCCPIAPPPPQCGDTSWNADTDKACEYGTNPDIFRDNGAYTGTVCLANNQACRSATNPCTCCGDSVLQSASGEECDLGSQNGVTGSGCTINCKTIPPSCGDGAWQNAYDKACEYGITPAIFKDNGAYTGTVCEQNAKACRGAGSLYSCTCCGDSVVQSSSPETSAPGPETCDLGANNGKDLNSDGHIGFGECRLGCTFCGDNVKQAAEICDLGRNNGIDLNKDGYIGEGECRLDCTFCGDGVFQKKKEFCDPMIKCPLDVPCTYANYNLWANSGFYPGCRQDCTACGDGLLQAGESCDDTRPFDQQLHTDFSDGPYKDTCPGACVQPRWIQRGLEQPISVQCLCLPEICDLKDNDAKCTHCDINEFTNNDPSYFSNLCSGPNSLWNLDLDKNQNGINCDCCKCCSDGETGNCCPTGVCSRDDFYVCDDSVDEGFSWDYKESQPELSTAVLSGQNVQQIPPGIDVLENLTDCSDDKTIRITEYPKYIYLKWQDLNNFFVLPEPNTKNLTNLQFSMEYFDEYSSITVQWFDYSTSTWNQIEGCGPFVSDVRETVACDLPPKLIALLAGDTPGGVAPYDVILRLVLNERVDI